MTRIHRPCNDLLSRIAVPAICLAIIAPAASALEPDKLFEKVSPSIVTVVAMRNDAGNSIGFGSGVVIAPQTVITNCHVLQRGKKIIVKTAREIYSARLVYPDAPRDLCQLTVPNLPSPAAESGSVYNLRVGQRVYAVGNPQQLELSLSDGLISALRDVKDGAPLIQTTTPMSPGSSGGGLFDSDGRLIGITTWGKRDSQNLNFAHPVDWIAEIPERAKVQIAKYRESQTAAAAASTSRVPSVSAAIEEPRTTPTTAVESPATEKSLAGAEFESLFRSERQLRVNNGSSSLRLITFRTDGSVDLNFALSFHSGRYSLNPSTGMLCMQFSVNFGQNSLHRLLSPYNDCFSVLQISARKYRFRAADKTEFIGES